MSNPMLTDEERADRMESALKAINARILGRYDDPDLMSFGPLDAHPTNDVLRIVESTLEEVS